MSPLSTYTTKQVIAVSPHPPAEDVVGVNPDTLVIGSALFSVVSCTAAICYFLFGLKQAIASVDNKIQTVAQDLGSRINQIAAEEKSDNEKILLRLEYKEGELRDLGNRHDRLQETVNQLIHYVNGFAAVEGHTFKFRTSRPIPED